MANVLKARGPVKCKSSKFDKITSLLKVVFFNTHDHQLWYYIMIVVSKKVDIILNT